jgi:glycosyltransferase involved in cell wall biosynthesis
MIKVLHVLNNLGSGGAESFVMNVYRNIDRSKVQFDFLIRSNQNGSIVEEIEKMGGNIYTLPPFPGKLLENYRALDKFLKLHASEYKAIHVHANSLIYVKPLQLAKKYGIPCRIIHSHNTKSSALMWHKFNFNRIDKWVTHRFACSDMAGKFMFSNKQYEIIANGIDLKKFQFDEEDRNNIRKKYKIENKTVIGNVGRFTPQKNHLFIIDIFDEYHKKNPDSVLMLVGEGQDKEKVWNYVLHKGLFDDVIFTGAVSDVYRYMSAMDKFLFPSLWEGLGIVLIEAQANGLPCICSEEIPQEAICSPSTICFYLKNSAQDWANKLYELNRIGGGQISQELLQYDISNVSYKLQQFYLKE